ncbi:MAG: hypothetical protein K6G64_09870 [Eubacterium sp.]|nr:hypothetical protein [Eubacterium sp.]
MKSLANEIRYEKERTERIRKRAEIELMRLGKVEAKNIWVTKKHSTLQFYEREHDKYRYIPSNQTEEAIKSVKYEYYDRIYKNAIKREKILDKLEEGLKAYSIDSVYEKMGRGKQKLIEPLSMTREQYREMWLNEEYQGKTFYEDNLEIRTDRGERVRSKSEKIIADKLYREGIAYRYEYPLEIPGWGTIYPDFTILDEENRRNLIYEHFGMMDNEEYANNAIAKLQLYAEAGYILGDDLFITMETSTKPFDSRMLDGIIKQIKN